MSFNTNTQSFQMPRGAEVDKILVCGSKSGQGIWKTNTAAGVGSPLTIQEDGGSIETNTTLIDFVGSNLTASSTGAGSVQIDVADNILDGVTVDGSTATPNDVLTFSGGQWIPVAPAVGAANIGLVAKDGATVITNDVTSTVGTTSGGVRGDNLGNDAVAAGAATIAGNLSVALGREAISAVSAVAVGYQADASTNSVAIGLRADASTADQSVAIGVDSEANDRAVAVGRNSTGSGVDSVAVGNGAVASDTDAVAIGLSSTAALEGTAIGGGVCTAGSNSTAIGHAADGSGSTATALGTACVASTSAAVAVGAIATSNSTSTTAIGYNSDANNVEATAVGHTAVASGIAATVVGSAATGANVSVAVGQSADAAGASVVVGYQASTTADNGTAIGYQADVSIQDGLALGFGATSSAATSGLAMTVPAASLVTEGVLQSIQSSVNSNLVRIPAVSFFSSSELNPTSVVYTGITGPSTINWHVRFTRIGDIVFGSIHSSLPCDFTSNDVSVELNNPLGASISSHINGSGTFKDNDNDSTSCQIRNPPDATRITISAYETAGMSVSFFTGVFYGQIL